MSSLQAKALRRKFKEWRMGTWSYLGERETLTGSWGAAMRSGISQAKETTAQTKPFAQAAA